MASRFAEITVVLVVFLFVFFSFFLFTYRKGNRKSKNLLALFFMTLGLSVAEVFLVSNGTYDAFPQFAFILNHLIFLYGPLLWLLTKSLTIADFSLKKIDFLHFIPFTLAALSSIFTFHIRDIEFKKTFLERANDSDTITNILISGFVLLSICLYLYFSFKAIKAYRLKIRQKVSNVDRINLGWLLHVLTGFAGILVFSILLQSISIIFGESDLLYVFLLILLFGMLIFIMSSIVKGLKNDVLFTEEIDERLEKTTAKSEEFDSEQLQRLRNFMIKEQSFLDSKLSLKSLADQFSMSSRELSKLINNGTKQSFFDFVNSYRIKYAQQQMLNPTDEKITILEIMYASGFNSKSSFNTAFKKHTKMTPSEWKKANTTTN